MGKNLKALLVLLVSGGLCACAATSHDPRPAAQVIATRPSPDWGRGEASAPPGFAEFCDRLPAQCAHGEPSTRRVPLTAESLALLKHVNLAINRSIRPQDDRSHYGVDEFWTIPIDGFGDCDDYVMVKRRALSNLGFPDAAMRIAEVFAPRFVRHVVLVLRTDKGNYVLDNLTDDVVTWDHRPYGWIKWQDEESATGWASLRENTITAPIGRVSLKAPD